jgi:predicted nuclease of predicted toxin-antitoxin system
MILWIDAQLSPALARWINSTFGIPAMALRDLGLRDATDREIFIAGRQAGAIVLTKDGDFLRLVQELGSPPPVILITCGNTSNANLRQILERALPAALELLQSGESVVEVR